MRRPKLVVKWFYITVFFTVPVHVSAALASDAAANGTGKKKPAAQWQRAIPRRMGGGKWY
jgi:hypothetical protein